MVNVTTVKGDNWSALYIDGQKRLEGRNITLREIAMVLDERPVTQFDEVECDISDFPLSFRDLKEVI